ncbi:NAD(P)H-quinone oxidoreductase [Burkholderia ubonensis]|uniref:NAD(P)H-quinone oxidoreductase n=1 Tax=Burkholderia ubonensis TaxID=101571 RepID=A0AB74D2B0_9BURK|nr:NAD(P)H-quinone oxidoreductase [Burkholderia ubonensis]PAJ78573.1 zinc-binding dehydrogenase [Burkholderia ubonensis]PAJ84424.1 zinc-binding dehydrogenase [Burkholderia ubonensis]PAJ92057.1 zinc-binding dehydrogenase [Burkholderia ubonensis]PAJ99419.1 zinc-binding dehydrogenase [Burkholderia ubonensis]PAK05375.1 zinc-binding dehydrogenase [Burkholderia ubonensis]
MTAIEITQPGAPDVLAPVQRPVPAPAADQVLIRVHAAGVNGPDLLQRKGLYDPPPGASDIPGLEIAGEIVAVGRDVTRFALGERVCALITGGGYAEYAVAHESNVLAIPDGLSMVEAAAMPETFLTVWLNLFQRGRFTAGDSVLIHGGASGIGTTATMLAKAFGASAIITTVSSDVQRDASRALGADVVVNYRNEDFVEAAMRATNGRGVDVVVDIVAGDYVARNYAAAAMNGRIVQIGVIKGPAQALDLFPMLTKRLTHLGSTLRSRTPAEKAALMEDLERVVWPHIRRGTVKPLIDRTFDLDDARAAHARMEASAHIGKVVLTTAAARSA